MRLFEWDKIYINPLYGQCRPQIDFPKLMSLYQKGDLKLDQMITRKYRLEELERAFRICWRGGMLRGWLSFNYKFFDKTLFNKE